ncbi:MAG: hypothetical protein NTV72_03050 [Candidatus Taylorbacteria bacterium]|nr:hypothetical protein [Candidatus Taylorbacteria bacterium]
MKTKLISTIKVVVLALILTLGITYLYAWTGPTANPPDGNIAAPLNISSADQTKTGGITASGLTATTKMVIPVLSSDPATPVSGQIWIKQ